MKIEDNILAITNTIFRNRENWIFVTDEQKEKYFFIINRYFSKRYPYDSQLLNDKSIDKITGMNLWFHFMEGKPYPSWFWSKPKITENKKDELDLELVKKAHNLHQDEIEFIKRFYCDELQEEIKYLKDLQKK